MIRAGLVAIAGVMALCSAAAAKGGAMALPPMEVDVGATTPVEGGQAVGPATDLLIGVHWASLFWHPTNYEVGFGYVGSYRPLKPGYRQLAERAVQPTDEDRLMLHGGYMTLGRTLISQPHFRTWVELRGELMRGHTPDRSFSAIGGAVRFAAEMFSSGSGGASDHNSIVLFAGTFALGVYIEASHRDLASELGPTGVTTGVTVRIPFLFVAAS